MKFPRFSGNLFITLRRLKCLDIPNLKRPGFYPVNIKIKAVELSLKYDVMFEDVMFKNVAQALDIHPLMLSRWHKEYLEGKFKKLPRYQSNNALS